jgi:23S rRNA (uracil1939-C5)-methyltransferase
VEPVCEKARACGGCALQHMAYSAQLDYKWNKVKNCLERIGGIQNAADYMEPVYGMAYPFAYRNKMQFPVGLDKEGNAVLGFYAGRTHSLIGLTECAIGHPVNREIIRAMKAFIDQFHISVYNEGNHKGLLRHVLTRVGFQTGELMVCLVVNGTSVPHADVLRDMLEGAVARYNEQNVRETDGTTDSRTGSQTDGQTDSKTDGKTDSTTDGKTDGKTGGKTHSTAQKLRLVSLVFNINTEKTNRILGAETRLLAGQEYITDYIGNIAFHISAQSFYQVNPAQTRVLYEKALDYADLNGTETVWDMYCGIGTISLFLAQKAKQVFGVEIVPQAIEDAKKNAALNGIGNAEFYVGKAEEVVPEIYKSGQPGARADVIVVDPPRKGCDEVLLSTITEMAPKRMVYVSCDPATLARDLKYLLEHGFTLEKVAVVDQFSHSSHTEVVTCLNRT